MALSDEMDVQGSAPMPPSPQLPALFWFTPRGDGDDLRWHGPPLRDRDHPIGREAEALLSELDLRMPELPLHSWHVVWQLTTRAKAAATERQLLEEHALAGVAERHRLADERLARLSDERDELGLQVDKARNSMADEESAFAEAAARGGLVGCTRTADAAAFLRVLDGTPDESPAPDEPEVAETLPEPSHEKPTKLGVVLLWIAPLVCGFMLALTLGSLLGIISLGDLRRGGSSLWIALFAALFGMVIVYLLGEFISRAVRAIAELTVGKQYPEALPPTKPRSSFVLFTLLTFAGLVAAAEILAEALGLQALHQQRLQELHRFDSTIGVSGMHFAVYLLLGVLITAPYLLYKAGLAWSSYRAPNPIPPAVPEVAAAPPATQVQSPAVQEAITRAHRVTQLRQLVARLVAQLIEVETAYRAAEHIRADSSFDPATQHRLDAAYAAACRETACVHDLIERLIEAREKVIGRPRMVEDG
jgi:hypothetical protein